MPSERSSASAITGEKAAREKARSISSQTCCRPAWMTPRVMGSRVIGPIRHRLKWPEIASGSRLERVRIRICPCCPLRPGARLDPRAGGLASSGDGRWTAITGACRRTRRGGTSCGRSSGRAGRGRSAGASASSWRRGRRSGTGRRRSGRSGCGAQAGCGGPGPTSGLVAFRRGRAGRVVRGRAADGLSGAPAGLPGALGGAGGGEGGRERLGGHLLLRPRGLPPAGGELRARPRRGRLRAGAGGAGARGLSDADRAGAGDRLGRAQRRGRAASSRPRGSGR